MDVEIIWTSGKYRSTFFNKKTKVRSLGPLRDILAKFKWRDRWFYVCGDIGATYRIIVFDVVTGASALHTTVVNQLVQDLVKDVVKWIEDGVSKKEHGGKNIHQIIFEVEQQQTFMGLDVAVLNTIL